MENDNKNIKTDEEENKDQHEGIIESLGLEPFEEMVRHDSAIE